MKNNNKTNMVMLALAAVALIAVNAGVWVASQKGIMPPVESVPVWGAFIVLNVVSLLWAVSLLGLQPLVVTIAYVAGGFLAYHGVRGMSGINVAEVTSAGAVYGAFGALAVGNATAKVRLAFFRKGQVPFIFVIAGLLVIDGVLNSQVSQAGVPVLLNALAIPFVVAGVAVGLIWMVLNRVGIGRSASAAEHAAEEESAAAAEETVSVTEKMVIQMPEKAVAVEKPERIAAEKKAQPVAPKPAPKPAPRRAPEPVVAKAAEPVVARTVEPVKEEAFFPLEIDKDDDYILPKDERLLQVDEAEPFSMPAFDADSYSSGIQKDENSGGVMVKEPAVAKAAVKPVEKPDEAKAAVQPPVEAPEVKKVESNEDWLTDHLSLLNKLK